MKTFKALESAKTEQGNKISIIEIKKASTNDKL